MRRILCVFQLITLACTAAAWAQGDVLRKALTLMKAERPLEAEAALQSIAGQDPDFASAQALLGFLLLQRAHLAQAESAFGQALQHNPDDSAARFGLGVALLRKGSAEQAARLLEKASRDPVVGSRAGAEWIRSLSPHIAAYHSVLGFLRQTRGQNGRALEEYRKAAALEPRRLSTYFNIITLCRAARNWPAVEQWTRQALALDQNHPLLYQELARALERLGDASGAESARDEAERTYDAELLCMQALRASRAGRPADAEDRLKQAVQKNPRLSKGWIDLGRIRFTDGRWSEAYDAYLMALEEDPGNPSAHLGMAEVLQAQGRSDDALRIYSRALERGLSHADLMAGMAGTLFSQGRVPEADEMMRRAIRELPDHPDLLAYLGYLQEAAGKNLEALGTYSSALRFNAVQAKALLGKATSQLELGRPERAAADFAALAELSPGSAAAWRGLVQAYRRSGDLQAAHSASASCLEHNPADAQCSEQLASLNLEMGRYGDAAAHYNLALAYWNLHQYQPALAHALAAEREGVVQAQAVARTLAAYLSPQKH